MPDWFLKYGFAVLIFCLSLLFGYVAIYFSLISTQRTKLSLPWVNIIESLAIGIFLGAGSLHLLPDSQSGFEHYGYHYPFAFLLAMTCFLFLLGLEQYSTSLRHTHEPFHKKLALFTALLLSIHSFLEGSAVGVSQEWATTSLIMLAILAHKGAAAFALAIQLMTAEISRILKILSFSFFAAATPIGIIFGLKLIGNTTPHSPEVAIFNALAAGTFLYLGCLHGFEKAPLISHCRKFSAFISTLLGFFIMALLALWV